MSQTPAFKWAQDEKQIFLTIQIGSAKIDQAEFQPQEFIFKATDPNNTLYELKLELAKEVEPAGCKYVARDRHVEVVFAKKEKGKKTLLEPYFKRQIAI